MTLEKRQLGAGGPMVSAIGFGCMSFAGFFGEADDEVSLQTLAEVEKAGIDFDQEVLNIQVPAKRPPKQIMFIPALLLYALVWFLQRGRKRKLEAAA